MMKELFGCCNDFVFKDPYERKPRYPAFNSNRGSRFLEVTTDPLNVTTNKVPLVAKKNQTFDGFNQTRFDTKASDTHQ